MHDDGIRSRYINTGFNDGGTEQDVKALLHEVAHNFFEFALMHLAMGNRDSRLGQ